MSVVVPTRDRWPLLSAHAVPSALSQEDVDLELIVVDDGSTDGTATRLAAISDSRLRTIRNDSPQGVASARNAGIAAARGRWLALLDDDDLWSPQKLRVQLDVASRRAADFVYAAGVLVDDEKRVVAADIFPSETELVVRLLGSNVIPGGCSGVLARTQLVRDVGGFDERLTYTEDWDLWIRLALQGRVAACPEVLVAHVQHPNNALFRYRPDVVSEVELVLEKYTAEQDAVSIDVSRAQVLEWLAQEYLRAGNDVDAARAYVRIARERRSLRDVARALLALSGRRVRAAVRRARQLVGIVKVDADIRNAPPDPGWLELYR